MKISEHRKRRDGGVYWTFRAENARERDWLIVHELIPSKFRNSDGMLFYGGDQIVKELAERTFGAKANDDNAEHGENEYKGDDMSQDETKEMTVGELRKQAAEKAKAEGRPTTDLRTKWNRSQLEAYLTEGTWADVNTPAMPQPGTAGADAFGQMMAAMISPYINVTPDPELLQEIVDEAVKNRTRLVKVEHVETGTTKDMGMQHKEFERILKLVRRRKNIMLVGPPGTGKTHCAGSVAEALELSFHPVSVGQQTTKSDLLGFMDVHGNPIWTALKRAYVEGGIFLLDEVDAGNANVLTVLNAALANGQCAFPDGVHKKHEDFVCIAAANTYGKGGDRLFVGRNQLDAASLDRFVVVNFDVDENLELALSPNEVWTRRVQAYRRAAANLKLQVVISPRASYNGDLLEDFPWAEVEEMVLWKGLPRDQVEKIKAAA
jgi:MoxR-like ATPase